MRRGKFHKRKNRFPAVLLAVLILAVMGASFGGVRAYLSHSGGQVENSFTTEVHPTIAVSDDYKVTVSNTDYAVYLRAAVVVNWKSEGTGNLLAALPEKSQTGDYLVNADWKDGGDGFYYYKQAVTNGQTTSPIVSLSTSSKTGYTLVANVAVQAIQAVGQTDGNNPVDAVDAAWGITADAIKGTGS